MQACGIISKQAQQTAFLPATVHGTLYQTTRALNSGSSEHFPVLPSELFSIYGALPYLVRIG